MPCVSSKIPGTGVARRSSGLAPGILAARAMRGSPVRSNCACCTSRLTLPPPDLALWTKILVPALLIAIVGYAARFPGAADADEFWQVLVDIRHDGGAIWKGA